MALEIRVSNLLPLISFATRAGSASQADLAALSAEVDALQAEMPNKADKVTTISGAGLVTGGGSLAANRVLTVPKATGAQALAGTDDTAAVTSLALKTPLDAIRNITITGTTLATGGGNLTANRQIDVAKATGAETEAMTIDSKAVTPFSLAGLIGGILAAIDALSDRLEILFDIVAETQPRALIIISHGQSLARRQLPRVTVGVTIPDYFGPVGGLDAADFSTFTGNLDHMQKAVNYASFVPLMESANGEGWGSGLGYQFRLNSANGPMTFFASARAASHWRDIRPGTGPWGNLLNYVYYARRLFQSQGELNIRPRMVWTHIEAECDTIAPGGGTSEAVITAEQTVTLQEEVLRCYHHDMSIVFGKDMSALPIFITPLNSAAYQDITLSAVNTDPARGGASRRAQAGQLAAAKGNPKLVLLPPHYQFWANMDGDGIHLQGGGRRLHAELCGEIIDRVDAGDTYMPPHVLSATRSGAVITATCHFPGGEGGERDTTTFAEPTNWPNSRYGIQFWNNGTSAFINVTDATIAGSTLTVTLASTPSGAGELRVAQQPWPTTGTNANTWTPRCNFRDAVMNTVAENATVLYHYMLPQTVSVA
jgi:hypothetical protein